jgi:hypothetical protein
MAWFRLLYLSLLMRSYFVVKGEKDNFNDRLIRSGASVYWTLVLYEWQVASAGDKVSLE